MVMDRVFIGVCGMDTHMAQRPSKQMRLLFSAMSRRAKQVIVVADSSKVGMISPAVICSVTDIDILITDDGISDDAVTAFQRSDVHVVIA